MPDSPLEPDYKALWQRMQVALLAACDEMGQVMSCADNYADCYEADVEASVMLSWHRYMAAEEAQAWQHIR